MIQERHQDPPFSLKTVFRVIRAFFLVLALFIFLIGINFAQMSSLILLPFSRKGFRAFNRSCANTWWGTCCFIAKKLHGCHLIITGDEIPPYESAILFANHQQMTDIFLIMIFAVPKGRLGDLKWFVKDILKYVPGAGWGMLFLDCLFVKRNWDVDKNKINSLFSKFKKYQIPIWLVSFVEGTRIKPEKLKRSQDYAKEKGLPVLENVMLPRTKGFVATIQGLGDHAKVIYDITIGYPQGTPSLWQVAKGTATRFELHVRRFNVKDLPPPENAAALSQWLIERFVEKDQWLTQFYQRQRAIGATPDPLNAEPNDDPSSRTTKQDGQTTVLSEFL